MKPVYRFDETGNVRKRGYTNFNAQRRLQRVAKLYAEMLLQRDVDYNILYITAYNSDKQRVILPIPSKQTLEKRVKKILNNHRLQEMLVEELRKKMEENGFSVADAIKKRKEVLEGAIAKKDFTNANRALDSFDDKLGIGVNSVKEGSPLIRDDDTKQLSFAHLSKVKEIDYKEIKQLRANHLQSNEQQVN